MRAHLRPANALLDRLAAAGAGGNLPIGMKAEQLAAAEHRLRLLGRARENSCTSTSSANAPLAIRSCSAPFRSPSLRTNQMPRLAVPTEVLTREGNRTASRNSLFGCHDPRRRLRQAQSIEQPTEPGLAVRGAIALKIRQRQPDAARPAARRTRANRNPCSWVGSSTSNAGGQQSLDKGQKAGGIVAQPGQR